MTLPRRFPIKTTIPVQTKVLALQGRPASIEQIRCCGIGFFDGILSSHHS
jgi:hypothetical protein